MNADYIDFIDSNSVREHLRRRPPLPPAMQCILIAQSVCRSLEDKLAALRKIRAETPSEGFAEGEYQLACNDLDFAAALDRHIQRKEERLAAFLAPAPDVVYVPHDPRNGYDLATFAMFAECLDSLRAIKPDDGSEHITIARCRTGKPDDMLRGFLGPGKVLVDVETEEDGRIDSGSDEWRWNFAKAYVRVPHGFHPGDIVRWGEDDYSVVVHPELPNIFEKWRRGLDCSCQFFSTLAFSPDMTHPYPRGGVFFIHDVFPLGAPAVERVEPPELPDKYGVLLAVADVVEESSCICQLLESYSNGDLDSLVEEARKNRIGPNAERAVSQSDYRLRICRLMYLLVQNWCICRHFQLFNPGSESYAQAINGLKFCMNHLKCLGVRKRLNKEKSDKWLILVEEFEAYELDDAEHVSRIVKEAFDSEHITDDSQRMKVASDFAENIMGLIDAIAYDSKDVEEYVRSTFMTGNAKPVLPKCPRKVASARAFVNRLSSQFDAGKIRELTPELKDRLLDSFNILHDYGKKAPWASREADFVSSLLAFIPLARTESGERKS